MPNKEMHKERLGCHVHLAPCPLESMLTAVGSPWTLVLWAHFHFFSNYYFLKREGEGGEVIFRVLPGTLFSGPAVPFLNVSGHILS